jgi:hypothetical protein
MKERMQSPEKKIVKSKQIFYNVEEELKESSL